jgi:thiamine monophosphate kinase
VSLKTLATGVAAVAAIGAAAAGLTTLASSGPAASQVQPVVFSAPLPLDQTANPPTADQLTTVLSNLADPNVPFANKSGLVEGGITSGQAHLADHEMKKAAKNGELPLTFNVSDIQPAGANAASAVVAISGPKLQAPVSENLTFVNQGSWMLSHDSAMMLVQAVSGD